MKHEFTDQQIDHAMGVSQEVTGDDYILEVSLEGIRAFLDALPEPTQDDWEECAFEDIRKGDTIKYETPDALIEPKHPVFRNFGDELAFVGDMKVWNHPDAKWYRIPAPVQHPDPAKHPVILEPHTTDDEVFDYAVWDTEDFYLCYTHEGEFMRGAEPSEITKFTPAKVVEDDR